MRYLITLCCSCLLATGLFDGRPPGQPDSLIQVLQTPIADQKKVHTCVLISKEYMEMSDSLQAVKYANMAIALAEEIDEQSGKANGFAILGMYYFWLDNFERALNFQLKALSIYQDTGDAEGLADVLHEIGLVYEHQGKLNQALDYYRQSLRSYEKMGNQEAMANTANDIGFVYRKKGNLDEALTYHLQSLQTYEALGNNEGITSAANEVAHVYQKKGDLIRALDYHMRSLQISEELGNQRVIAGAYRKIARFYEQNGTFWQALEYYEKSLKICEQIAYPKGIAITCNKIGLLHQKSGQLKRVLDYHLKALQIYKREKDREGVAATFNKIGFFYHKKNDFDQALDAYFKSLGVLRTLGKKGGIAAVLSNIGEIYEKTGKPQEALDFYGKSLRIFEEIGAEMSKATTLGKIAKIHRQQGNHLLARQSLAEVLRIAEVTGDHHLNLVGARQLSAVEQKLGNHQQALKYYKQYKQVSDQLFNEANTKAIARLEANYEFEQEKDSIAYANNREKLLIRQRQQVLQYGGLAGMLAMLLVIYTLYRYYRSKHKANELLEVQRAEISKKNKELQALDQYKSRFFANISHELRTPLTLISGPLESLKLREQAHASAATNNDLRLIQQNTLKLKGLINDILDLSKLEACKLTLDEEVVSIHLLLKRAFYCFHSLANRCGITYDLQAEALPDSYVMMDADKLEKIVVNLLSNALKFTPPDGRVSLQAFSKGQQLIIKVSDTGSGIPQVDLPHVFDRYFQSTQPDAPLQGGSGIGLAMAKEYTHLLGGTLLVNSTVGEGSVFRLTVPYKVAEQEEVAQLEQKIAAVVGEVEEATLLYDAPEVAEFLAGHRPRILVVDDHPDMLQYIKGLLHHDYQVAVADNGQQALNHLAKHRVDLIISDVMMPVMDGFELLGKVRECVVHQYIPFIILTALGNEANRLEALSMGVDEYLAKPFSPAELLARITNMLNRYEVRKQLQQNQKKAPLVAAEEKPVVSGELAFVESGEPTPQKGKAFIARVEAVLVAELENEEFRLEKIADDFAISYSYFRHKVKELTGLSPKQLQQEIALQTARKLLEAHHYGNLTAVAHSVGKRNVTRFKQLYQKRFGKDPSEYFLS